MNKHSQGRSASLFGGFLIIAILWAAMILTTMAWSGPIFWSWLIGGLVVIGIIALISQWRAPRAKQGDDKAQAIMDSTVDAIIIINEQRIVQSFNTGAQQLFGYTEEEVLGKNVKLLMPDSFARHHDQYVNNYITTGEKKIMGIGREVEGQRADGSIFPMHLSLGEITQGGKRMFVGIGKDITELKQA